MYRTQVVTGSAIESVLKSYDGIPTEVSKVYAIDTRSNEILATISSCMSIDTQPSLLTYDMIKVLQSVTSLLSNISLVKLVQSALNTPEVLQSRASIDLSMVNIVEDYQIRREVQQAGVIRGRTSSTGRPQQRASPSRTRTSSVGSRRAKSRPRSASRHVKRVPSVERGVTANVEFEEPILPPSSPALMPLVDRGAYITVLCAAPPLQYIVSEGKKTIQIAWFGSRMLQQNSARQLAQIDKVRCQTMDPLKHEQLKMDLIRELEEERLLSFESFLFSMRRGKPFAKTVTTFGGSVKSSRRERESLSSGATEYYRDRGRQASSSHAI